MNSSPNPTLTTVPRSKCPAVKNNAQAAVTHIMQPANKHRAALGSALNTEGDDAIALDPGMFAPFRYVFIHDLDHDFPRCLSARPNRWAAMSLPEL